MSDVLERLIDPLRSRLMTMIGRCVLRAVDDGKGMQLVQAATRAGALGDGYERFQNYGFTSHPKAGAEGVIVFPGGNYDHGIVVVMDDRRFRFKNLEPGEVAMFTDEGDVLHFKRGREVLLETQTFHVKASEKVVIETPLIDTTADLEADGDITDRMGSGGSSMRDMRNVYDGHTHPENDNGGPTGTPNQAMG